MHPTYSTNMAYLYHNNEWWISDNEDSDKRKFSLIKIERIVDGMVHLYIYTHTHTHIHIYKYIYMYIYI